MAWLHLILFGAWMTLIGVWGFLVYQQFLVRRLGLILEPLPAHSEVFERWPSVCVVIAACNETEYIQACLQSVLDDGYPHLSVRVIDDRSQDDTARLVEAMTADDPRVSLVRVMELPPGWMGKSHALWQGTRDLDAQWLLFLDADCRLKPGAVAAVVREAVQRDVDMLSLWPRHDSQSFWEHMLMPLCGGITALWFGSPRVNESASRRAFANGQFMLIRREAYERIDGHRCVRDALIEDVPFAEHAKAAGLRCWVGGGQKLFSVRMYTNLSAIVNGWARIYVGALRSGAMLLASVAWLLFGSLWPYLVVICLIAAHLGGSAGLGPMERQMAGLAAVHLLLMMVVSYRFWGMGGCRRRYLWLYPVSVIFVIAILFRAWWWLKVSRSVTWRTTRYPITGDGRILQV